jgi:muconolactone D-isomerase
LEFLAHIKFAYPASLSPAARKKLVEEEEEAIAELVKAGHFLRAWRVPGTREMWTLWKAKDATEFHAMISKLPLWPYIDATVHALGAHHIDPSPESLHGDQFTDR